MFKYGDKVKIKSGFFEGMVGCAINSNDNIVTVHINTYGLKNVITDLKVKFSEKDLEKLEEIKK